MESKFKKEKRYMRHKRVRAKISGQALKPRLHVFKSAKHVYAQLIDDEKGKVIIAANDKEIKKIKTKSQTSEAKDKKNKESQELLTGKKALAYNVGKLIAKKALERKIEKVVFDRGSCKYHGRVKALAEGAREGGLKF